MRIRETSADAKVFVGIFVLALIVRYLWAYLSGVDNFSFPDWNRYDSQSDGILQGNFDLEEPLFITAPFFPYLVAIFKLAFGDAFAQALEGYQICLSAASVVFLALTAREIFDDQRVTILTGLAFSLYPITLYWAHVFGQETTFQALLIISLYFLVRFLKSRKTGFLLTASVLFSLTLLTKSHIQLALPFLVGSIILTAPRFRNGLRDSLLLIGVILAMTAPYGIYNKVVNGAYVISSSGGGGHFLTGHNDDVYAFIVNPPPKGTEEYERLKNMDFRIFSQISPSIEGLNDAEKQKIYLYAALRWMKENPRKSFDLAIKNGLNFLTPGFDRAHHAPNLWLISFLVSFPVFGLAYFEISRRFLSNWREHVVVLSLFLAMLSFSLLFYSQNRFRVITIEPWYLMYACSATIFIYDKIIKTLGVRAREIVRL
jgi:hypothetical protein